MKTIAYDTRPGYSIYEASKEAVELAKQEENSIIFLFNQHKITIRKGDTQEKVLNEWDRLQNASRRD